jgi:uncharacterized protein YggE
MVILLLLTALLVCPVTAWAEDELHFQKPTLMVTGTGRLAVVPDTAFVTFGMETAGKSISDAQRQNNEGMQRVTQRLRELQIEKERIQTSSFMVSPQYQPPSRRSFDAPPAPPQIVGYLVSNSVTVEVRNTDRVPAVIEAAMAAGANHFQGLRWALRDEQQARLEALKQAAARAREKAIALSQALTVKLVRLISVNEAGHVGQPVPMAARSMVALEGGGNEPPMFPGEMKMEATVTLLYEVAPE